MTSADADLPVGQVPSAESFGLSSAPSGRMEQRIARAFVVGTFLVFGAVAPLARTGLPHIPAFVPAYESALALTDLMTAVLLFGQFSRLRSWSLLCIASGYLFDALITLPHMLSFPGVFSTNGLIGSTDQTTAWLYVFWHGGFPLFVLGYAWLEGSGKRTAVRVSGPVGTAIAGAVAAVVLSTLAATMIATVGSSFLPTVIVADDYSALNRTGISPGILALCAVAFAALLVRGRGKVLNVWLLVVMAAWLCDVALSATIGSARYDLGWYGGRLFGLLAASFVLAALLLEMHRLYASLAEALEQSRAHAAELMRSRADLARAQRLEAIGELTGGIAHDFNNLLTAIVGGLGFILRNPEDHARVRRLGENAMKAAERGTRLIQQLLSFSRRQNLNPETVNPNALLTDFQSLAQAATGEPITLELNLDRLVHPVRVDVGEFQAAILNLLVNARDALPDGGTVRLETRNVALGRSEAGEDVNPGEHVMISVIDAGIGMDAQTQARAFEPFFTTKNIGQGSGLGLSQVFGFAKSAGGHLKVTSELGFGTTVSLYLPRSNEAVFQPTEPEGSIIRRASTGETVLLVEDDEVVSLASAENLRDLGYRLLTADNAARALDILRGSGRIDILFSDVVMPGGMNGVQLAVEARRLRPEIKVLLTSGFTGGVLARDAMALDVPLLDKPYRQDALAAKLWLVLRTG